MIPGARLVLLGRQGAGKGTQCVRLARHYVVPHISTGDMLRMAVKEGTDFGRKAKEYMDAGRAAARRRHGRHRRRAPRPGTTPPTAGYILDGFPRTVGQAEALAEITAETGHPLDLVIDLEVPEDVVIERISKRRVCVDCGTNYSVDCAAPVRLDLRQLRRRGRTSATTTPRRRSATGSSSTPSRPSRSSPGTRAGTCWSPSTGWATPTRSPGRLDPGRRCRTTGPIVGRRRR